jgi:hypothetical protein
MVSRKNGIPWTEEEMAAIAKRKTEGLTAWNKLDAPGQMDGYQAYIGFDKLRPGHAAVIRAFREAAKTIADCGILPTTVGITGLPSAPLRGKNPVGFEFCVTSDVSAAQGEKILAEVKQKTGATLFIQ